MTREQAIQGWIIPAIKNTWSEKNCQEIIKALEQEPETGRWIEQEGYDGDTYYDCSECGESFCLIDGTPTDNLYNYCPNCGAKMAESEDEE